MGNNSNKSFPGGRRIDLRKRLELKTREQTLIYYMQKVENAISGIKRTLRNGFYPMGLFGCVEERLDDRYCGDCEIYPMCRAIGWLVHVFDAQYLQAHPDEGIQELLVGLLNAYLLKLKREKELMIGPRSRTTRIRMERGLPKKVKKEEEKDLTN